MLKSYGIVFQAVFPSDIEENEVKEEDDYDSAVLMMDSGYDQDTIDQRALYAGYYLAGQQNIWSSLYWKLKRDLNYSLDKLGLLDDEEVEQEEEEN